MKKDNLDGRRAYTVGGIPATDSSRGIIIQNGQKTMVK